MRMCFNWKVLAGLGAIGLAIWVVAPGAAAAALPLLLILACPLSMLFMMGAMNRQGAPAEATVGVSGAGRYTCPMYPQVSAPQPGACPTCGMPLEQAPASVPTAGETLTREERLAQLQARLQTLGEQQAALAREMQDLEASSQPENRPGAVEQAERVARAADRRG